MSSARRIKYHSLDFSLNKIKMDSVDRSISKERPKSRIAISTDDPFVNLFVKQREGGDCFSDGDDDATPINIQIGQVKNLLNDLQKHLDQNDSRGSCKLLKEINNLLNPLQTPHTSHMTSDGATSPP